MGCESYINLSGGVDSTYYLWKHSQDNPDKRIMIHHCLLNEVRVDVEKRATEKILEYLMRNGFDNYEYTESRFTRKGIGGYVYDLEVIAFMSGLILKNKKHKDIKEIILSYCYEETPIIRRHLEGGGTLNNLGTGYRTRRAIDVIQIIAQRRFDFNIPYMHKTKQDMISEMPKELFELTWYCRRPIDGNPCGKCFNCKRVHKQ